MGDRNDSHTVPSRPDSPGVRLVKVGLWPDAVVNALEREAGLSRERADDVLKLAPVTFYVPKDEADAERVKRAIEYAGGKAQVAWPPSVARPPIAAGQVGAGALGFAHSGSLYLVGWGEDFIGIWERQEAGGPVHRFRRTREGWDSALRTALTLDPSLVQVEPEWHAVPPRPEMRTVMAIVLALVGTALTVPAFVQTLSAPCLPGEPGVADWAGSLWFLAVLGISSLVLALYRLQGERRRNSRWGRILAGSAVGVATLGGLLWAVVSLCGASAGL